MTTLIKLRGVHSVTVTVYSTGTELAVHWHAAVYALRRRMNELIESPRDSERLIPGCIGADFCK